MFILFVSNVLEAGCPGPRVISIFFFRSYHLQTYRDLAITSSTGPFGEYMAGIHNEEDLSVDPDEVDLGLDSVFIVRFSEI